mmetsp:Transcript_13661/g.20649  ORF Transcript_13661/g.20649 Transcript_13661/m.20649 type:complete len:311 (+) Transcript_13661:2-934(+)
MQTQNMKKDKRKGSITGISSPKVEPPPREYNELTEMIDHAVDYDWTSARMLLGKEYSIDINLDEEQRQLLYGPEATPRIHHEDMPSFGWGKKNVLSVRCAWSKIRLPEQQQMRQLWQQQPEMVASNPHYTWLNEEKAEQDKALEMLSKGTEMFLKSLLEGAVQAARQRQNLDGIRIWHQQHNPAPPHLSLRLGCDVRRQVALAAGNAARTAQRMEEALGREKRNDFLVELNNQKTLADASSIEDIARIPKLPDAASAADYAAKRSFEVYGGKGATEPPLGRVTKKARITKDDLDKGRMKISTNRHRRLLF